MKKISLSQRTVLARMDAGHMLIVSEVLTPHRYWFQAVDDTPATNVSRVTMSTLVDAGYVIKGKSDDAFQWQMELTEAGRAAIAPEEIKITENYYASRIWWHRWSLLTDVCYKTPDMKFGRDRIRISTSLRWASEADGSKNKFEPVSVNWSAIGSVSAAEALEYSQAMLFAAKEAVRMEKEAERRSAIS